MRIEAIMMHNAADIATITLGAVCGRAGISELTLRRHFHKAVGMTWEDYRQRLRLCMALDRLDRTSLGIGVIAADVGYESEAAFARAFRAVVGVAPGDYRRR